MPNSSANLKEAINSLLAQPLASIAATLDPVLARRIQGATNSDFGETLQELLNSSDASIDSFRVMKDAIRSAKATGKSSVPPQLLEHLYLLIIGGALVRNHPLIT